MQQSINLKEIELAMDKFGEVVVFRNDKNDIFIMSMEEYKNKKIREEIIKKLKESEKEIENKEGIESDIFFEELRQKYEY